MNTQRDYTIASDTERGTVIMAQATHIDLTEPADYIVPVDPMEELGCDSCQ